MSQASRQVNQGGAHRERFLPLVAEKLRYYVYALRDPRDGKIFYVGKGTGDRVYLHARKARKVDASESSRQLKLERIRQIHSAGKSVEIEIIRHQLSSEAAAFEVEAAVIDALRIAGVTLSNLAGGHGSEHGWRPLAEIEGQYAARPVAIQHPVLLIRLRNLPTNEEELYRRTRKWWKLDRRRAETRELALGVFQGVVQAVYRIERWERPSAKDIERDPKRRGRSGFRGSPDLAMDKLYMLGDVHQYLPRGGQNPIRYVDP